MRATAAAAARRGVGWQAVRVCALEQDMAMLPAGAETEIGEKVTRREQTRMVRANHRKCLLRSVKRITKKGRGDRGETEPPRGAAWRGAAWRGRAST